MYVYSTDGEPVGFVFETNIYDLEGRAAGADRRLPGAPVRRHLCRRMVPRHGGAPPAGPAADDPAGAGPAAPPAMAASYRLRAVVDYGYPDAFPSLREGSPAEGWREAAE